MYPNYVGSEAVRASENLIFGQYECDRGSIHASLYPYIRNTVGCMEFGGTFLNKRLERNNGKRKRTAEELNISERTLYRKIKEYGLESRNQHKK